LRHSSLICPTVLLNQPRAESRRSFERSPVLDTAMFEILE